MAYLRQKTVRNKKTGKVYKYWQLVEGKWVDGKVKQEVLKHLGPFDSKEEAAEAAQVPLVTKDEFEDMTHYLVMDCPKCGGDGRVPAGTSDTGRKLSMPCAKCGGTGLVSRP